MLRKLKENLANNSGNATYLWGVIFLLVMVAVTAGILFVSSRYAVISDLKKTTQSTLDSYVDCKSVEIYSSIKNSHDYTGTLTVSDFKESLKNALHLNNNLECYENNKLKYRISDVKIEFIEDETTLKVRSTYRLYMPFYFANSNVAQIDTNLTTESRFNFK